MIRCKKCGEKIERCASCGTPITLKDIAGAMGTIGGSKSKYSLPHDEAVKRGRAGGKARWRNCTRETNNERECRGGEAGEAGEGGEGGVEGEECGY